MTVSIMVDHSLKILLVDDSEFILQRIQYLLHGMQQVKQVKTATSAEEADEWIESYNPSLVFLDINLPGKNGLQMLKDIRQNKAIDPVVVILTNNTLSGYRNECIQAGADYFLDKAKDFAIIPDIIAETAAKMLVSKNFNTHGS